MGPVYVLKRDPIVTTLRLKKHGSCLYEVIGDPEAHPAVGVEVGSPGATSRSRG